MDGTKLWQAGHRAAEVRVVTDQGVVVLKLK